MGVIYSTAVTDAYYEVVNVTPKLEGKLYADILLGFVMSINSEYDPFRNEHAILSYTKYCI